MKHSNNLCEEMHKVIHEAIEISRKSTKKSKFEKEGSCHMEKSNSCGMIPKNLESK